MISKASTDVAVRVHVIAIYEIAISLIVYCARERVLDLVPERLYRRLSIMSSDDAVESFEIGMW